MFLLCCRVLYQTMQPAIGEAPICVATILCNEVIEDVRTHNKSAIGIFNAVNTPNLPAVHPRMFAMVSVTNIKGQCSLAMVMRSPTGKEILSIDGKIENAEPLATYDLVVELMGVPLEEQGVHFFDVMHGSKVLGGRRFQVILTPQ